MFKVEIKDISEGKIYIKEEKTLYNLDFEKKLSDWSREGTRGGETISVPTSTNGFNQGDKVKTMRKDALGILVSDSNSIGVSSTGVYFMNTRANSNAGSIQVLPSNFDKCCINFSVRKLSVKDTNWINEKDPYLAPDTKNPHYAAFSYDSLIYSLFHSSSNQCSMKNFGYEKNSLMNMKNNFFFVSREKMFQLADKHSNQECYDDARHDEDRFVAKTILAIESNKYDGVKFSSEAQLVLDLARELVEDTFKYRVDFNKVQPEYQINNWDCGWYQVKGLLKWIEDNKLSEPISEKYGEFKQAYKALGDKMRPMVYELGFLKK